MVPHHAFGEEAEENLIWVASGRITAAQYAARLFPAGSHQVFSPKMVCSDGATTAAHNPVRRLAWLAGSFGGSWRPRLPGNVAPPAQKKLRPLPVDLVHPVKSSQVHREGPQFLLGGRSNVAGQARPPGASKAPGEPR